MATHVMFGKSGVQAVPVHRRAAVQQPAAAQPMVTESLQPSKTPFSGHDNLNEIDFGRTFSARYAEDTSMIVVFFLWLFLGGFGAHRFYLGHKWVGASIAGLGTFNSLLFFTAGFSTIMSYFSGSGVTSNGLISFLVVMVIHFLWVFFDFFYILVRKFTSR